MTDNFIENSLKRIDEKIAKIESMLQDYSYFNGYEVCRNGFTIGHNLNDATYLLTETMIAIKETRYDKDLINLIDRIVDISKAGI